jgi:hypothetical protein
VRRNSYFACMNAFQPGYPDDCRLPQQRQQAAAGHGGDFEGAAARVVARFTGEHVVLQDDNSRQGMVDIEIRYRDRAPGYVEVITDTEQSYAALWSAIQQRQDRFEAPSLTRTWWVTPSPATRLKVLEPRLPTILQAIADSGDLFEYAVLDQHLDTHHNPLVRQLAAAGIVELISRSLRPGENGAIVLLTPPIGGDPGGDSRALCDYVAAFLHDPARVDVRRKLADTGADERHVFIGLTVTTPWRVFHSLDKEYSELPDMTPSLPTEITHVWICSWPFGRCLAWFPDRGWFDPSHHWATA